MFSLPEHFPMLSPPSRRVEGTAPDPGRHKQEEVVEQSYLDIAMAFPHLRR